MNQTAPGQYHRRSIRLPGWDYAAAGAYFITICARGGDCLLGDITDSAMRLSPWGQMVWDCWQAIPEHYDQVTLDAWVVMPNHVHGVVVITGTVGAQHAAPLQAPAPSRRTNVQPGSLGAIVRSFKSVTTRHINRLRGTPGESFWQRNYWEHIVRSETELARIREYIDNNPARWAEDRLHPRAARNPFSDAR